MEVREQNKSGEVDMQEVKMTGLKGKHGGRREEVSGIHIIRHHILISNRKARKPNRQVYPKLDQRHLEIPVSPWSTHCCTPGTLSALSWAMIASLIAKCPASLG